MSFAAGPWTVLVEARVIGAGQDDFTYARDRVLTWQMHRSAGLRVECARDVELGRRVSVSVGVGRLALAAPCEVVAVVDAVNEAGFAYGTLAGHPECGEEAFLVRRLHNDLVVGSVAAFSRPAWRVAKVLAPLATRAQAVAARRYLTAMSAMSATSV